MVSRQSELFTKDIEYPLSMPRALTGVLMPYSTCAGWSKVVGLCLHQKVSATEGIEVSQQSQVIGRRTRQLFRQFNACREIYRYSHGRRRRVEAVRGFSCHASNGTTIARRDYPDVVRQGRQPTSAIKETVNVGDGRRPLIERHRSDKVKFSGALAERGM
jgi:hypothetical protein